MGEANNYIVPFEIVITLEGGYYRLNITHPGYKGRIRKRICNGNQEKHDTLLSHLKVELEKYFIGVKETYKYLRIEDDDIANTKFKELINK